MYSPLYCIGIGLSDGEVMERMWSYLRCYTRMTKEIRQAHRVDVLSYIMDIQQKTNSVSIIVYCIWLLLYISLLANRWKKAKERNSVAQETYSSLTNSSSGIVLPSQLLLCADT